MPTKIDLPPDLEAFTRACATSGRYSDASDVIRAALRRLQDADARRTAFVNMLDEAEAEAVRNGSYDLDDVLAEVDAVIDATAR